MPDALTHYISSYLVSRAALKPKQAALAALAGPLPDLDALRAHRWVTHSLVLALAAVLLAALYALHITLDALTSLTPALWPPAPSIWRIAVSGRISPQGPAPAASAAVATRPHQLHQEYVEGPLMSETGLALLNTPKAYWPEAARARRAARKPGGACSSPSGSWKRGKR
jgi:hypothetical protein